jgi:hypothetical protein
MLAVFGIGQTELFILGLICCFLVLPVLIAVIVIFVMIANKKQP